MYTVITLHDTKGVVRFVGKTKQDAKTWLRDKHGEARKTTGPSYHLPISEFIRQQEAEYKTIGYAIHGTNLTLEDATALQRRLLASHPTALNQRTKGATLQFKELS